MKLSLAMVLFSGFLVSCASTSGDRQPAQDETSKYLPALKNGKHAWAANDPELKRGDLDIWKLQDMAKNKEFDALNDLFNHGLTMRSLPVGYSAGTGAPFPNTIIGEAFLESMTGALWRGKIFFEGNSAVESHGYNRIGRLAAKSTYKIIPQASFKTYLLVGGGEASVYDQPELGTGATSNFVVLNYAQPISDANTAIEHLLKDEIAVFDVMVAVPGKYGPLYVGKTWRGSYDPKTDAFHAYHTDKLIAWYFLDFNEGALTEQTANHWTGGTEVKIPFIEHKK